MPPSGSQPLAAERVVIVGTGLLGASLGLGLRAGGFRGQRVGVGRNVQTVRRALELGCVDEASDDLEAALADETLVVLATPISALGAILQRLGKYGAKRLIITDVGSTKQYVCDEARKHLADPKRFIGSHPMAGSEKHGPNAAQAGLFVGKPCVLTPETGADDAALNLVRQLWRSLGMRLLEMSPAEHDRRVASISHLPHAVACALVNLAQRGDGMSMASTGFRDTTRVASGDPLVWSDIFTTNRRAVAESLDALIEELARFRDLLDEKDEAQLTTWLQAAKSHRDDWLRGSHLATGENHE